MSTAMSTDPSNHQILILQTMWEMKALGTRAATMEDLLSRLSDLSKTEASEKLKDLEARGLVTTPNRTKDERFALTLLGAAYIRQLQEKKLGDLASRR
jgi:DNA-binding MarR family transcriptional regulator